MVSSPRGEVVKVLDVDGPKVAKHDLSADYNALALLIKDSSESRPA
jgi:hypothetical protein